jgi:uncharacterized glyoxalase superfamily protein PhnB
MAQDIFPVLRYRDAAAAIDWLERAFGFARDMVVPGPHGTVTHAQLRHGSGMVMLGSASDDSPWAQPAGAAAIYVVVEDPDAHHARAVQAGADIVMELTDQDYGSREYGARDPEGNLWSFGTYRPASKHAVPGVTRIVPYADGADIPSSRDFYVEVLGLEVGMEDPVLDLGSPANPTAQIVIPPPGMDDPQPRFAVDVGDAGAVDAAHAEVLRRGLRVAYPLSDEPWGIRRFFVEDPGGTIVSVLAHTGANAR